MAAILPDVPDLPLILLSAAAVFASGVVQGATGFGFVIIAGPVLATYLEPTLVVPVMVSLGFVVTLGVLYHGRRWVDVRRVWVLTLAGAVSTPVGALLLVSLASGTLKLIMGGVVVATGLAMLFGLHRATRHERAASVPVGLASGLLAGSAGVAGAPIILFFANQGVDPRTFRANIVFYLQIVSLVALPSFFVGGVLTADALTLAAALLPASLAGMGAGIWLSSRLSAVLFRRAALVVVLIAGVGAMAAGIAGL